MYGFRHYGLCSDDKEEKFFSVSIDELLSGEKIISIAEKENKSNLKNMCSLCFGITDILYLTLIILPLYSISAGERICAVNLFVFIEKTLFNQMVFPIMFLLIMLCGAAKAVLSFMKIEKGQKALTIVSMLLGIVTVLLLALTREAYAISTAFLLLMIKVALLLKCKN